MSRLRSAVNNVKADLMEITNPVAMRKELLKAKNYGKKIGLFCLNIHNHVLYGTIDSLEELNSEQAVVFNWYDDLNQRCQSYIFLNEIGAIQIQKSK
jgi:hypothetical protein